MSGSRFPLGDRFRVVKPLGRGAGGSVFLATDRGRGDQQVAVKILGGGSALSAHRRGYNRRFRELTRSSHPNLARVYDFDLTGRSWFYTGEVVEGENVPRFFKEPDNRSSAVVMTILGQVAAALEHLRRRGLVHGDCTPGNVLCRREGDRVVVKLIDYGRVSSTDTIAQDLRGFARGLLEILPGAVEADKEASRLLRRVATTKPGERLEEPRAVIEAIRALDPSLVLDVAVGAQVIGREAELALIRETLQEARQGRHHLRTVLIHGEAGSGKSALLEEARIEAVLLGFRVVQRSPEASRQGFSDQDALLNQAVAFGCPRTLTSRRYPDVAERKLSYTRGLLATRDAGPLAILVDDIESLDPDSRDFIEHLAGYFALKQEPGLALIVTARTEGIPADRSVQVPLAPLGRPQLARLAREIAGAVPDDELTAQLERVSGGRPGVAAEVLQASRDRLIVEGGALRLAPGAAPSLPPGRREQVLRALEREPDVSRNALRLLSLAPQPVHERILKIVLKPLDARPALEALLDAGWVEESGGEWWIPDPLTREAIASELSAEERRSLHIRFTLAVQDTGRPISLDRLRLIVGHYLGSGRIREGEPWARRLLESLHKHQAFVEAGATAARLADGADPKVASEFLKQAQEWLRKAGRYDEMVAAARRRVQIDPVPAARAALARALMERGDYQASLSAYDEVLSEKSLAADVKADCHLGKVESLRVLRKLDEALQELDAAEATGKADPAYAKYLRGSIYESAGRNATETVALLEAALKQAKAERNVELEIRCKTSIAGPLRYPLKNIAACLKYLRDASILAYQHTLRIRAANIDGIRGSEYELTGRHARAISYKQLALDVGLQSGHWMLTSNHAMNLANAAVLHGDPAVAESAANLAIEYARKTGQGYVVETAMADLALLKAQRGLMNEAGRLLAEMKSVAKVPGLVRTQPARMAGLVHWMAGLWDRADALLTPLVKTLLETEAPIDAAPAIFALADACYHLDRSVEPELLQLARKELKYWKNVFADGVYDFVEALFRWKQGNRESARRLMDAANRQFILETGKDFQMTALLYRARFTEKPAVAANDAMTVYHSALDLGRLRLAEEAAEVVGEIASKSSNSAGAQRWFEEARRILKERRSAWFDDADLKSVLDARERELEARQGTAPAVPAPATSAGDLTPIKRLLEMERLINSNADWDVMLRRIMDAMLQLSGAERGLLFVVKDSKARLRMRRNYIKPELEGADYRFSKSIVDRVHETGEIFHSADAQQDPRLSGAISPKELGLKSVLCLPLAHRTTVTGIVYLDNRKASAVFETVDFELLDMFRRRIGLVLERVMLEEEIRQVKAERDRLLQQVRGLARAKGRPIPPKRRRERPRTAPFLPILGESQALSRALRTLDRAAAASGSVLILGETGTGKELAAKAVHLSSPRAAGPFIAINCAAIPETMLETELFGSARGAFTGADRDRTGLFHAADRGTLFLDEIGEMPPALQAKMLRVVETGEIRRVGATATEKVDVRIVAASNRDLPRMAKTGNFRPDLLYRLKGMHVTLPPLRERKDDIPILIDAFLRQMEQKTGKLPTVENEAMRMLIEYDWPGNVRELHHLLESAAVLGEGQITAEAIEELIGKPIHQPLTLKEGYERVERSMMVEALKTEGSAMRAAQRIKVVRSQFYRLIKKYKLEKYLPQRVSHRGPKKVSQSSSVPT